MRSNPRLTCLLALLTFAASAIADPGVQRDEGDGYDVFEAEFRWLEVEDIGEEVAELGDNDFAGPFDIGFEFPYFGELFTRFYIGSNGFIGFGPTAEYETSDYREFPNAIRPNNIIAPYWKDLNPAIFWGEAQVIYGTREGKLVVEFLRYPEQNPDGRSPENTITMQVVLAPDGDILFQYRRVGDAFDQSRGSIGLEGPGGEDGISLKFDREGLEIDSETAFLITEHGPGNFLIWDGGSRTNSGDAQEEALRAAGHTTAHLRLRANQQLPGDLQEYEAVFVNLGNYGIDGRGYHRLTNEEGRSLANYLDAGGSLYLEGGDFWSRDQRTPVHEYFFIESDVDGHSARGPVEGIEESFAEGLSFESYEAFDNDFVDNLTVVGGAVPVLSFRDRDQVAVGMASFRGRIYRTIGSSLEFGALVDGDGGSKQDLAERIVEFFRSPPPDYFPPTNLRAFPGDRRVRLEWDFVDRDRQGIRIGIQHQIAALTPRNRAKPDPEARLQIARLRRELANLELEEGVGRDEHFGFNVYLDGQLIDEVNGRSYTLLELQNGRQYRFAVSAVYRDPDGESEPTEEVLATPMGRITPPVTIDFEQNSGGFSPHPGANGWEWGRPAVGAASGERAWGTLLNRPYPDLAELELLTPVIDLENERNIWLSFNHFLDTEGGWDGGRVEISLDGGERWDVLQPVGGYPDAAIFAFDEGPGFSGRSGGYQNVVFNLTPYADERFNLRFIFKSDESNFRDYAGWFIDDLRLFTPRIGDVIVRTLDNNTGNALPNVAVRLGNNLYQQTSDAQGVARFFAIPAGNYHLVGSRRYYTDVEADIQLDANQQLEVEVGLWPYASELSLSEESIELELESGEEDHRRVSLRNTGDLETDFQIFLDYWPDGQAQAVPEGEGNPQNGGLRRDEPWRLIETIQLTAPTGNPFVTSAAMVRSGRPGAYRYVVGGGSINGENTKFYRLTRGGDLEISFNQGIHDFESGWGVRDLEYDGEDLYGSATNNRLYSIDPANGAFIAEALRSPLTINRAVAYDPASDAFWVGDRDNTWYKIARGGQILDRYSLHGLEGVSGMAWNPSDPDGAYLYVHNQEPGGGAALYRYNPRTRDLERQMQTATPEEGTAGGAFVTYLYDTQNYTLGVVIQGVNGDYLKLYELWPRSSWISVSPSSGRLASGAQVDLTVSFDMTGLISDELSANIVAHDKRSDVSVFTTVLARVNGEAATLLGSVSLDRQYPVQLVNLNLNGRTARPSEDGDYAFIGLLPGRYQLKAAAPGFIPFASDSFDLSADEEMNLDVNLVHVQTGIISGRVRDVRRDEGWIAGAEVTAVNEADPQIFRFDTTDADGAFSFSLPVGNYRVRPRLVGWVTEAEENVGVADGEATNVNFTMDDRLPVSIVRANGLHDSYIEVSWLPPGTFTQSSWMQYDAGAVTNGVYLRGRDDILALRFVPESECDVDSISIYFTQGGDFGLPSAWPNRDPDPLWLHIFAEDPETGLPGALLLSHFLDRFHRLGWVTVGVDSVRFLNRPFFVGYRHDAGAANYDAVGLDPEFDNPGSVFMRLDNDWRRFDGLPGDCRIRVKVKQYLDQEPERAPLVEAVPFTSADPSAFGAVWLNPAPPVRAADESAEATQLGLPDDRKLRRDPPGGYNVIVDDNLAAENVQSLLWRHVVGSEGENQAHTYSIKAIYNGEALDGAEVEGRANLPPDSARNLTFVNNGEDFTLTWTNPTQNADRSQLVDFAGCEVYINGEVVAETGPGERTYAGRIEEGSEGYYEVKVVARDEVPNRAAATPRRAPLGVSQVFTFEPMNAVLSVNPLGSWLRSNILRNGPGTAHTGSYAFGTRPVEGEYSNNAYWTATTLTEFVVTSPNARLEFYHWYSTEAGHDGGQLQISVDGGAFQLVTPEGGYPDQTVGAFGNRPGWSGESGVWIFAAVDLREYRGRSIKLRWVFASDEQINWYPGWYLDDIAIWGVRPPVLAQIYGSVRDQQDRPVSRANVSAGRYSTQADENGFYRLTGIVPGEYRGIASKAGYQSAGREFELAGRDSVLVDFMLRRPDLSVDSAQFRVSLGGNDHLSSSVRITNNGDFEVPYRLQLLGMNPARERRVRALANFIGGGAGRDRPGDIQFDFNAFSATGQRRIMGAEYLNDRFYLTSADPDRGLAISILDRDGSLIRTVGQPLARPVGWGLRDLAADGELLYASQNDSIYGFTIDGIFRSVQIGAPITVNRALAYEPEADGFWAAEWDSPWYLIDREGEIQQSWDEHGLRGVYGLAWHPADPAGMPLYAVNLEADGSTAIYRANPAEGAIERLYDFDGPPTGCFLTGSWDSGRWILGMVNGDQPQRLRGVEINRRVNWVTLSPLEGELQPGATDEIEVEFSVPAGADRGDAYAVDISVQAFGSEAISIHCSLEILEGFRHFDEPEISDQFMTVSVEQAELWGRELAVGSEIAAMTPRGIVGGLARWVEAPAEIRAYINQLAFTAGDPLHFVIWDASTNMEVTPEVEYTEGDSIVFPGREASVNLTIRRPDSQKIDIRRGWNLISSYILPFDREVPEVFAAPHQRGHVVLVKDGAGRFWAPAHNFNGMREWSPLEGYLVNLSQADSLIVEGERISEETPIPLNAGWNSVSYLLTEAVDSRIAFESVIGALRIAKNGGGAFMSPRYNYYGLGRLLPGAGYKVNVEREIDLIYRRGDRLAAEFSPPPAFENQIPPTGSDMSLLITGAPIDPTVGECELVVYVGDSRRVVGKVRVTGFPAGVPVRGDDTLSSGIDGAQIGERLEVALFRDGQQVAKLKQGESLNYLQDDFAAIDLVEAGEPLPTTLTLSGAFPNPFNGATTIRFGLPEAARVDLGIFDLSGREVWRTGTTAKEAGWYDVSIDADNWPSGVYWVRLDAGAGFRTARIALVR